MPDRVGNSTGRSRDPDFTDALDTQRVDMGIVLLDQQGFHDRHVGIHRDVVVGEVGIQRWPGAPVHNGTLVPRKRHAPDHAAEYLAAHEMRLDDAPRGHGADKTAYADLAKP